MFSFRLVFLCPLSVGAVRNKLVLDGSTCAALTNKGSFSTVPVSVGTPPQTLDVVADTGSNALIVESCVCEDDGHCKKDGKCFRGHGKSKTFSIADKPKQIKITYGSGPVEAIVSSDQVAVGSVSVKMKDSLFLMVNKQLHGLELQGILGLGLPAHDNKLMEEKGFLDIAKIDRFSMCFNPNGKDGMLQLGNSVSMHKPLGSVGQVHWGLDFRGVSVGSDSKVSFCTSTKAGQVTPCGAIIDSGTTLILAPKAHLAKLFVQICDAWPACKKRAAKTIRKLQKKLPERVGSIRQRTAKVMDLNTVFVANVKALTSKIATCKLGGMPSLSFQLRGADGTHETLELAPDDYIIETHVRKMKDVKRWLGGVIPTKMKIPTGGKKKICVPAFKSHDYNTKKNGPVWIFGTPFFYKYTIAYDRMSSPPAISFAAGGCTGCGSGGSSSLLASTVSTRRFLATDPRVPYFNSSLPL